MLLSNSLSSISSSSSTWLDLLGACFTRFAFKEVSFIGEFEESLFLGSLFILGESLGLEVELEDLIMEAIDKDEEDDLRRRCLTFLKLTLVEIFSSVNV